MKWFVAVVALLVFAHLLQLGLLVYSLYALLGAVLVSRWLTRRWADNLDATRSCNRLAVNEGDTVAVVVEVRNRGSVPIVWALLEDLLPRKAIVPPSPSLSVVGRRLHMVGLGPNRTKTLTYQLCFNRRGYYQIGPMVLETGDLFGLHRRYHVATKPHFVLVYPELVPVEGWDIASRRPIGEVRMGLRIYEDPTRIAGIRPYEPGDPLSRVHWKATARTGMLHSKVHEPSTIVGTTLILDFHEDSYPAGQEPIRSELAITAAASIAHAVYEMNQPIGLVTNGLDAAERVRFEGWDADYRSRDVAREAASASVEARRWRPIEVPAERGPEAFRRIMEALARVEKTERLALSETIIESVGRIPRDTTALAVLGRVSPETAVTLGNLKRRGMAVSAIISAYAEHDFEASAGLLLAQGIEARHLPDRDAVATICRAQVLGAR